MVMLLHPFRVLVSGNPLTLGLRPAGSPQAVLFAPFQGALKASEQAVTGSWCLPVSRDAPGASPHSYPSLSKSCTQMSGW